MTTTYSAYVTCRDPMAAHDASVVASCHGLSCNRHGRLVSVMDSRRHRVEAYVNLVSQWDGVDVHFDVYPDDEPSTRDKQTPAAYDAESPKATV
jgi:hypothetical protein